MSVLIPQMGKGLGGLAERGMNAYYTGRQEAKEKETRAALGSLYGKDMGVLMSNAPETVDRIGAMQARDADQARAQAKADRESLEWDQGQADRNINLLRERAEPMKQFIKVARDLPPEQRLDVLVETMRPHIEADPQFAAAISAKFEDGVLDDADLDAFEKVSAIAAAQAQEGAPETRKMSLPGGMVQDQELVGGEWRDVGEPYDRRDPLKPYTNYNPDTGEFDMGFVDTRTGERVATGSKPKKEATEGERKAQGFLSRMQAAEKEIGRLGDFNPVTTGEMISGVTNKTKSPEKQRFDQAAADWIRAKLRTESGAAIPPEEMAGEYEVYFPVYGDSKEVIEQKARARKEAERQMGIMAGSSASSGSPEGGTVTTSSGATIEFVD